MKPGLSWLPNLRAGTGPLWMVRIKRDFDDDYCDFEVRAATAEEAEAKALAEAKRDPDFYFGRLDQPDYYVDDTHETEQIDEDGAA